MCMTKSRLISLRMSGVSVLEEIASIIDGRHVDGIENAGGAEELLQLKTVTVDDELCGDGTLCEDRTLRGVEGVVREEFCNCCELDGNTSMEALSDSDTLVWRERLGLSD